MLDTKIEIQLKLSLSQFRELALVAKLVDEIDDRYDKENNEVIDEIWGKYVFLISSGWIHDCVRDYNKDLKYLTIKDFLSEK